MPWLESEDGQSSARRLTVSLNGVWEVGESKNKDNPPRNFDHKAPVPGLLRSADPPFPDAGKFASRELQYNQRYLRPIFAGDSVKPEYDEVAFASYTGVSRQSRDYFWYRRTFRAPGGREHAFLDVLKAQFGSEVWVNGSRVGARESCYTAGRYDISALIRWNADNELMVRVGAHPGVLPDGNSYIADFEKHEWMPGIWDDVELHCFDGPAVDSVQVASRVTPKEILIETVLVNLEPHPVEANLSHRVTDVHGSGEFGVHRETVKLTPLGRVTHSCRIALPSTSTWSPESPVLYVLHTRTVGDEVKTRFGVREFRFETATKRAYLNGRIIFLRGSGLALHRFFEDPLCGALPWDEQWVRKLLGVGPKRMGWNTLKFSIGPVPRKWLDLADELGVLVIYEFPIWTLSPKTFFGFEKPFNRITLKQEMADWVRDNRNHSSIVIWDTSLESHLPWMAKEILPDVRKLDLSGRPWSDSLNAPSEPDDPYEDHPYEFSSNAIPALPRFDMINLESRGGFERPNLGGAPSGHACVIAEYGWLWVNRDGSPTQLTAVTFAGMPYPTATPEERIQTASYLLGGLTEYWRSFRHHAGVLFYGYLASSKPDAFTSDYFADVRSLKFHPAFEDYVREAFKPLGVYVNLWQRDLQAGADQDLVVMLCNDDNAEKRGTVSVTLEGTDGIVQLAKDAFVLGECGQQTLCFQIKLPKKYGPFTLKATADAGGGSQTISRRWVTLHENITGLKAQPGQDVQFGQQFGKEKQ